MSRYINPYMVPYMSPYINSYMVSYKNVQKCSFCLKKMIQKVGIKNRMKNICVGHRMQASNLDEILHHGSLAIWLR